MNYDFTHVNSSPIEKIREAETEMGNRVSLPDGYTLGKYIGQGSLVHVNEVKDAAGNTYALKSPLKPKTWNEWPILRTAILADILLRGIEGEFRVPRIIKAGGYYIIEDKLELEEGISSSEVENLSESKRDTLSRGMAEFMHAFNFPSPDKLQAVADYQKGEMFDRAGDLSGLWAEHYPREFADFLQNDNNASSMVYLDIKPANWFIDADGKFACPDLNALRPGYVATQFRKMHYLMYDEDFLKKLAGHYMDIHRERV